MDGNKVVNAQNLAELAKKIKEGGSEQHLYWHSVFFTLEHTGWTIKGYIILLSDSSEAIDSAAFRQLIKDNSTANFLYINGIVKDGVGTVHQGCSLNYAATNQVTFAYWNTTSGDLNTQMEDLSNLSVYSDKINQIF